MFLPLPLILVGSNLKMNEIHKDSLPFALAIFGKLMIASAVVFFVSSLLFPNMPSEARLAIVLLNAVPGAVASYIISDRLDVEADFVSSALVISTGLSVITIPFWLYFLI